VRILAFAYACEPERGSEPAAGWWWAQMLARLGETWVITRANNRALIEAELRVNGATPSVHFVYVDLPPRLLRWKRGQRGVRLYYVLWQLAALMEARRLSRQNRFDVAWHLTLANVWIGSTASFLGVPFVYGPVGGGVSPPWRLARSLGPKGVAYELLRAGGHKLGRYLNPLSRASWRRASLILVQNEETRRWLPRQHRIKAEVFPNIVLDRMPAERQTRTPRVLLFAGRLMPLKGVSMAIRALVQLPDWRLIVCGDGPDSERLLGLAAKLKVRDRIDFRGWVDRDEVLRTMRQEASVFLLPSLHDEAGWVVVEAMAAGVPVVCLAVGGPGSLAGPDMSVRPGGMRVTVDRIARRVLDVADMEPGQIRRQAQEFLVPPRTARLEAVLRQRLPVELIRENRDEPSPERSI
jgi:glycosyltransferase involved in cell wall biosynthesis